MNKPGKRFPLSLAELGDRSSRKAPAEPVGGRARTPQTATRNAAGNHASDGSERFPRGPVTAGPASGNAGSAGGKRASPVPAFQADRQAPVVSDGIRRAMVERLAQQGIRDTKVLAAMQAVPRHLFIEPALVSQAYIDASLPIGHHQTISQPYIVARMIEVMRDNGWGGKLDRVLEIGTGCGYQAAVLSLLATEVYSIERIRPLHELAKSNLRPLRIANIRLQFGDGMLGLAQVAPFDGIILAAAGLEVPTALLEQMRIGGRLVAPVGGRHQVLQLIERKSKFDWSTATLEDCHFVPLRPGTA
jgi:protein-L-isoaspartate(D-aspartate) O-methyltransferase